MKHVLFNGHLSSTASVIVMNGPVDTLCYRLPDTGHNYCPILTDYIWNGGGVPFPFLNKPEIGQLFSKDVFVFFTAEVLIVYGLFGLRLDFNVNMVASAPWREVRAKFQVVWT